MTIISTTVGTNPIEKMDLVDLVVNKRIQTGVLGCNLKNDRMISLCFQGKPFNINAPTTNGKEAEWFYEDLQDLLELTPKKMSFPSQGTGMQK